MRNFEGIEKMVPTLREIPGVGASSARELIRNGISTVAEVAGAEVADLLPLRGFGEVRAAEVIAAAKRIVSREPAEQAASTSAVALMTAETSPDPVPGEALEEDPVRPGDDKPEEPEKAKKAKKGGKKGKKSKKKRDKKKDDKKKGKREKNKKSNKKKKGSKKKKK